VLRDRGDEAGAMTEARKGMLAWAAVIVPTWLVMILCTHWEPVAHDGWGHWSWHRNLGMSFDNLLAFIKATYEHNNPRLGQVLTLLVYTPGPWHSIVTPLFELALFYFLTLLVIGRWPSLRRADDALLFAVILAMAAVAVPSFGLMLFYRPFTGNYLFGLVINLALLVPYRLHFESPRTKTWWWAPPLFVLGFAAGLCNEHTGPALAALLVVAVVWFWRRGEGLVIWAAAGLTGLVLGGIMLFKAPGQDIRYKGLATQASTFGRLIERGFYDNARIIIVWLLWMLPLVAAVGFGLLVRYREQPPPQPRNRRIAELVLAALALAITLTLLLSPKQGSRLYLASVAIMCAALGGWLTAQLVSLRARVATAVLCAGVLLFAGFRMTRAYYHLGKEYRARVAILEAAPDHSVAEIPVYSIKRSRWSLGDDLLLDTIRNLVSYSFGLALIKLKDQREPTTPPPAEP
jgi:hypothetical protein